MKFLFNLQIFDLALYRTIKRTKRTIYDLSNPSTSTKHSLLYFSSKSLNIQANPQEKKNEIKFHPQITSFVLLRSSKRHICLRQSGRPQVAVLVLSFYISFFFFNFICLSVVFFSYTFLLFGTGTYFTILAAVQKLFSVHIAQFHTPIQNHSGLGINCAMGTPLRVHYDIVIKSYLLIGNAKRETERERKQRRTEPNGI